MSGMSCNPGDIVGIPFPYSDLKSKKKRPVLVLTYPDRHGDFICVAVTSVHTVECAVSIDKDSMSNGILPRQSWVRCDKLFTLSQSAVVRHFGSLHSKAYGNVLKKVCSNLGC
jgi:mRNA interferase MazF